MAETRVFVSHAPEDLETVQELLSPVRNLPLSVALAGEEVEPGRTRRNLEGQLANSQLMISVLTHDSADQHWVNQELGYAVAKGLPVIPIVEDERYLRGYIDGTDGVEFDPENPEVTIFNLLCRLRSELEPLGSLSTPEWFLEFTCSNNGCREQVVLDVDQRQKELWQQYKHGRTIAAECGDCGTTYEFNPATLGYIRRIEP